MTTRTIMKRYRAAGTNGLPTGSAEAGNVARPGGLGAVALIFLAAASLQAGTLTYENTSSNQFGTIDLVSGVFSQIGTLSQENTGLGVSGGNLYTGAQNTGNLYQIDPASGALTLIGSSSINYLDTGSTTGGLYAIGGANAAGAPLSLFSVNAATGASSLIGALGLSISTTVADTFGLSTGAGTLYLSFGPSFSSDTWYTLDTTTGAATAVGPIGIDAVSASVFESGTLWGASNYDGTTLTPRLITLDTATGAGAVASAITGGSTLVDGLAALPSSASPEPASWSLVAMALCAAGIMRRRA